MFRGEKGRLLPRGWARSMVIYGRPASGALALAWRDDHADGPPGFLALPSAA